MERAPHDQLRGFVKLALSLVDQTPAAGRPGSPRETETSAQVPLGEQGHARVVLLNDLNVDAQLAAANLAFIVDGVADHLEVAAGRDNAVHVPILSIIARTALEIAGQLSWLLDDSIGAEQRARRFLTWRFADLRAQRLLLGDFRPSNDESSAAVTELDRTEQELHSAAGSAGWVSKPTVQGSHLEAAALLDTEGKNERVPKNGELARLVSSTPSLYGLLSIPAHGVRFGMRHGMRVADSGDEVDSRRVLVGGFGLPVNTVIGLSVLAVDRACRLLAGWNGVDASRLHAAGEEIVRRAGIG